MSHWTTEKPTKPGWYWWKDIDRRERVVEIIDRGEGWLDASAVGLLWSVKNLAGEWQGPIVPVE